MSSGKGKGKEVAQPSGNGGGQFLSYDGQSLISLDSIPRPEVGGPGDVKDCIYVITSNLPRRRRDRARYEFYGTLREMWTMREQGFYSTWSRQGFLRLVCDRLQLPDYEREVDNDNGGIRTAVRMSARTGWQDSDAMRLDEQIRTFKHIWTEDKENCWFLVWHFEFAPSMFQAKEGQVPVHRPTFTTIPQDQAIPEPMSASISFCREGSSTSSHESSQGSSGAASNETVWPSFPFTPPFVSKPLPPRPLLGPRLRASTTTSKSSISSRGGTLVEKVSRLPKIIVRSLSSTSATTIASPSTTASSRPFISRPLTGSDLSERPTVLTELAFELKRGGIDDLNGLLPVTKPPSWHQWRVCCQLLPHLDPEQLAAHPRARAIGFVHSKLAVAPFQLWTAYQMLQGGGGFLAHDMGLGKTHCVLTAVVLKALVAGSKRRCEEFWARQPTRGRAPAPRHLPRNAMANSGFNMVCPSQRPGDVQCWCVPNGVTRQLGEALVPGASVISVPSDLMSDWVQALLQADFKPASYNFVVVGGSNNDVPPHLRQDLRLLMTTKFKMSASVPVTNPQQQQQNQQKQASVSVFESFDLTWTNRTTLEATGSYVFLTSHHNSTLNDTFRYRAQDLGMATATATFETGNIYGAPIGLHFIDEAHLPGVWTPSHYPMLLARRHKHIVGCDVWFVTGTPFPKDRFREVRAQLAVLNPALTLDLERLDARYKEAKYKLTPAKVYRFTRDFQRLFRDDLVLRFVDTTLFFGQPITGVQDVAPQIISRRVSPSSVLPLTIHKTTAMKTTTTIMSGDPRKHIQKLVDRLQTLLPPHLPYVDRLESRKQVADVLYLVSLFPAAASLINKHKLTLALHDDALREAIRTILPDRRDVTALPIVREYWARFATNSPKLQYLREEIDRVHKDCRVRPGQKKNNTTTTTTTTTSSSRKNGSSDSSNPWPKKCVVLTPNLSSAVFLYAWFAHNSHHDPYLRTRNVRPVFYHRDLSKRDKLQIREAFDNMTPPSSSSLDPIATAAAAAAAASSSSSSSSASKYRNYFIASADDAGTGLNLQAANYQILTSPLHRATAQAQAFRRTNRAGQLLPLVHKLLVLEDSPIDRINLVGQAGRRFRTDPFDVAGSGQGGMVALVEPTTPASESSQEDLALVAGTRPELNSDSD